MGRSLGAKPKSRIAPARPLPLAAAACAAFIAGCYTSPAHAAPAFDASRYYSPAYQPCLDKGEDMRGCTDTELKRWNDQINAVYRQLMASLSPDRQLALRASERAWIKKRDATCAKAAGSDFQRDDGSMGNDGLMVIDGCVLDATIERVLYLRAYK
jgi:uncharacterized protein YecT (DUF1311 family)